MGREKVRKRRGGRDGRERGERGGRERKGRQRRGGKKGREEEREAMGLYVWYVTVGRFQAMANLETLVHRRNKVTQKKS